MPSTNTIPEGLDEIPTSDGVLVRQRWFSWSVIPLAIFAAVWDSFLFVFYTLLLHSPHHPSWPILLFPVGHLAVGVAITYSVLTMFVNRTDVQVSSGAVQVRKGPLPWFGNKQVPVAEISELLVRPRAGNRGGETYSLMYVDHHRREQPLLTGIAQADRADYLAAVICQRLGVRLATA